MENKMGKQRVVTGDGNGTGKAGGLTLLFLGLLFCVLSFWPGMILKTEAAREASVSFYEDGDVVGCIGDSITHVTYSSLSYVEMLEQYYLSRFPERNIEFRNLGADGYKAGDVLNIYDQDPAFQGISKAVIMLGTNEAILGYAPEDYIAGMEQLIERLKAEGLKGEDIMILSPPICDQNCTLNYRNGSPRWTFEDRILTYMDRLETEAENWGVQYLDFHTSMAELTARLQEEDPGNTLTKDCIHPNAVGHRFIAFSIFQAQGGAEEALSEVFVSAQGEVRAVREELKDFYRGSRGMKWNLKTETLPVAAAEDVLAFRELFEPGNVSYQKLFRAEGFPEEAFCSVLMDETELGRFTGKELEQGIDFSVLEGYQQAAAEQIYELEEKRHRAAAEYRKMWIEVMMQRAVYTWEQIQTEYEKWRARDEELREEINAIVTEATGSVFTMAVIEEGYSIEELEQEAEEQARKEAEERERKEAEEQARKDAEEQERKEAEEQARKEAEERERKEAEEQARKDAEERERKEAEEQAIKEAEERAGHARLFRWGAGIVTGLVMVFAAAVWIRKKKRKEKEGQRKDREK